MMQPDTDHYAVDDDLHGSAQPHPRYRKIVSAAFTPRHMSALEPVRALAARSSTTSPMRLSSTKSPTSAPVSGDGDSPRCSAAPEEDEEQLREGPNATLHRAGQIRASERETTLRQPAHLLAGKHRRTKASTQTREGHPERAEPPSSTKKTVDALDHRRRDSTAPMGLIRARGNEPVARFHRLVGGGSRPVPAERQEVGGLTTR